MKFVPLNTQTHYSLQKAFTKPHEIIKYCKEFGYSAAAITDNCLSGVSEFCSLAEKKDIKPIISVRLPIDGYEIILIAKNYDGWIELIKVSNKSTFEALSFSDIKSLKNVIVILPTVDGFEQSIINKEIDYYTPNAKSILNTLLVEDYESKIRNIILDYHEAFGANFYIGLNRFVDCYKIHEVINDIFSELASAESVSVLALNNTFYAKESQQPLHCMLLAAGYKETLGRFYSMLEQPEYRCYYKHFNTVTGHFPSPEDISRLYSEDEINNTAEVAEKVSDFSIFQPPSLPKYQIGDMSESESLLHLCRQGWGEFSKSLTKKQYKEYGERMRSELDVLKEAKLEGYFLIVQEYVNWAKSQGAMIGPGRGCFLPDTRVMRPDGSYTEISSIKIGDVVIDAYGNEQSVYDVLEYEIDEDIVELEFENGVTIRCTKDHKFLTKDGVWIEAQNLTENDDVVEVSAKTEVSTQTATNIKQQEVGINEGSIIQGT